MFFIFFFQFSSRSFSFEISFFTKSLLCLVQFTKCATNFKCYIYLNCSSKEFSIYHWENSKWLQIILLFINVKYFYFHSFSDSLAKFYVFVSFFIYYSFIHYLENVYQLNCMYCSSVKKNARIKRYPNVIVFTNYVYRVQYIVCVRWVMQLAATITGCIYWPNKIESHKIEHKIHRALRFIELIILLNSVKKRLMEPNTYTLVID